MHRGAFARSDHEQGEWSGGRGPTRLSEVCEDIEPRRTSIGSDSEDTPEPAEAGGGLERRALPEALPYFTACRVKPCILSFAVKGQETTLGQAVGLARVGLQASFALRPVMPWRSPFVVKRIQVGCRIDLSLLGVRRVPRIEVAWDDGHVRESLASGWDSVTSSPDR